MSSVFKPKKFFLDKKLVDENGKKLDLKYCSFDLEFVDDNRFCFVDENGVKTPVVDSIEMLSDGRYIGKTDHKSKIILDLKLGYCSPEFVQETKNGIYVDATGELFTLSTELKPEKIGLFTKVTEYENSYSLGSEFFYNKVLTVKDKNGKCGVVNDKGKIVCPLVFDTLDISVKKVGTLYQYETNDKFVLTNKEGEIAYVGQNGNGVVNKYDYNLNVLLVRDDNRNKSAIFKFNPQKQIMEKQSVINHSVTQCISIDNKNYYVTIKNGAYGLVNEQGKQVLNNEYKSINLQKLKGKDYVLKLIGKNNKIGAFDLYNEKVIANTVYSEIDFEESAKTKNGLYKFFANNDNFNWGVVNSNGEIEVPFEYKHSTSTKFYTYREQENGQKISVLEIKDLQGEKAYFNILEENIIATEAEKAQVYKYESDLQSSGSSKPNDDIKKEPKSKKYSEEEKIGAAVIASIITESPIGGMIAYSIMDEAEKD